MLFKGKNGASFAVGCYRDQVSTELSGSDLLEEFNSIGEIALSMNDLALVLKGERFYEAIFSQEGDFPLAESVREKFGNNIIVTSAFNDGHVVIAVSDGKIILDGYTGTGGNLTDAIDAVALSGEYRLVQFGEICPQIERIKARVKTFGEVELETGSVLEALKPDNGLRFSDYDAQVAKWVSSNGAAKWLILFVAALILLFSIFDEPSDKDDVVVDPYESYRTSMLTASATTTVASLQSSIADLQKVEGWDLIKCEYAPGAWLCVLSPRKGYTVSELIETLALDSRLDIRLSDALVLVSNNALTESSLDGRNIFQLNHVLSSVRDHISSLSSTKSVQVKPLTQQGAFATQNIEIDANLANVEELNDWVVALNGKPVSMLRFTVSFESHALVVVAIIQIIGEV